MFSMNVEKQIRDSINEQTKLNVSIEDIHKMRYVPSADHELEKMLLCLQKGRTTILTPIKISGDGQGIEIGEIQTVSW